MTYQRYPYGKAIELTQAQIDEGFSKIPEDLKTEYFDLIDEKNRIENWSTKEIKYIEESRKNKLVGNLNALHANYKKMISCSGIDLNDLLTRLRKRGKK